MAQRALGQKLAALDQFLDHRAIGVAVLAFGRQDALAGEVAAPWARSSRPADQAEGVGIVAPR